MVYVGALPHDARACKKLTRDISWRVTDSGTLERTAQEVKTTPGHHGYPFIFAHTIAPAP